MLLPFLAGCGITLSPLAAKGTAYHASSWDRDAVYVIRKADDAFLKRDPALVALKYKKMKDSSFSFFRGSAPLFYQDVKGQQEQLSGITIPIQGDMHLENLGTYQTGAGAIAYDLNDFDEATQAPFTWEIARCAVSIRLALHEAGLKDANERVEAFVAAYLRHIKLLNGSSSLQQSYIPKDGPAAAAVRNAAQTSALGAMISNGKFILGKKLLAVSASDQTAIKNALSSYAATRPEAPGVFQVKDVAARIAGTASIGHYRFVALIEGATLSASDDRVLEIKEEDLPAAGGTNENQANRVCRAYGYFLPDPDPMLGFVKLKGAECLVRELQPAKNGVELKDLAEKDWDSFLETVAEVLARAHARSGHAEQILAEKDLSQRISDFAKEYEAQVEADYKAFKAKI